MLTETNNQYQNKILLIDGNSLFFKAFYGTKKFLDDGFGRTESGLAVNAIRVFAAMMVKVRSEFANYKILVAFDAHGYETYRTKFSFYKANRIKQPDDLNNQREPVRVLLSLMGISSVESKNHEADDIIGIFAKKYQKNNEIEIITSDKDLLQLVDDHITVHISKQGISKMESYNIKNFQALNDGLTPEQFIDFKAIVGDSSDNYKGIDGVGPKGAIPLLLKYHSLENIYNHLNELSPALQAKFNASKEQVMVSKNLATIMTEGQLGFDLNDLTIKPPSKFELIKFLNNLEIYNVAKTIKEEW